jgi:glycine hydroxymethyltransferase
MVIGGPLPHVMAAKAVAFVEALKPEFSEYATNIVANAKVLAGELKDKGMKIASGGTENHLMLIDVRSFGLTGRQAETAIRECGITLNRNSLPKDPNGPWYTSGLRIGTPAVTTLGMGRKEMKEIAEIIRLVLENTRPAEITKGPNAGKPSRAKYITEPEAASRAKELCSALLKRFPVYPELDLEFLKKSFC